jgi:hypothetical protein
MYIKKKKLFYQVIINHFLPHQPAATAISVLFVLLMRNGV